MSSRFNASRTIYVGNLPGDIREREVEDIFYKYGRIIDIDLKVPPRPPGYAFVEFEDTRDAEDAIRGRDGYEFDGYHLRVEMAHGGRASGAYGGGGGGGGGRDRDSRGPPPRGGGISRRTEYRVIVKNLPSSASWQDLKDHMRKAGDVCFAQVFKDGSGMMGIVDYTNEDDMKYAIRKLDDSEFGNRYSRGAYIRVYEEKEYKDRAKSESRSPDRERDRGRSYSRSRSASPKRRKDDDDDDDEKDKVDKARDDDSPKDDDRDKDDKKDEDED